MTKSKLFTPIKISDVELQNRIIVAPMCQYSAENGNATDWHLMHLGQFSVSGVGLLFTEATAVSSVGRISPGCLGLWSDENESALRRVVNFCNNYGNTKLGIQLAHSGRKGSTDLPWLGGGPISNKSDRGWGTVAPSSIPYADGWNIPMYIDDQLIEKIKTEFVSSAKRADRIGFDVFEIHMAHGYLLHEFLSPLSNKRNDKYGGGLEGRMKFPLEVFEEVKKVIPNNKALGVRFSAVDWVDESSWNLDESIEFCRELKLRGCDFIDVSSGGNSPRQKIDSGPGYQTGFASQIKQSTGIKTIAVGQITEPKQAELILRTNQADMVAIARSMLLNPRWAWNAAEVLEDNVAYAPQYMRSSKSLRGLPIPGNPPPQKS